MSAKKSKTHNISWKQPLDVALEIIIVGNSLGLDKESTSRDFCFHLFLYTQSYMVLWYKKVYWT
jgi:hypothetical protein